MSDEIQAYMMRVNEVTRQIYQGYIGKIENTLKAKQSFVGGTIDVLRLTDEIDIILNDDGKINQLLPNRALVKEGYKKLATLRDIGKVSIDSMTLIDWDDIYDILVGNLLAVRHNYEGDFISIRAEDIPVIEKMIKPCVPFKDYLLLANNDILPEYKPLEG